MVSWTEEGTHSVISFDKIISLSKEDLTIGCMCKVKKFEKYLAQVKGTGMFMTHIHTDLHSLDWFPASFDTLIRGVARGGLMGLEHPPLSSAIVGGAIQHNIYALSS